MGILDPFRTFDRVKNLIDQVAKLDIEVHFHNDFGMATANTLAAVKAGARAVNTTVYGLGERAGNASLEEVVLALKYQEGLVLPLRINRFKALAEYVSRVANDVIPPRKPVIGNRVFAHEAGIHVDGILKNPLNYEPLDPEEVGQTRSLVIGKHSGSSGLLYKLNSLGVQASLVEAQQILPQIRKMATKLKRSLFDYEVLEIYQQSLALFSINSCFP